MDEKKIYEELRKPFGLECYDIDTSRGFALTSLKAQYISIRLNEVLGMSNWDFNGEFDGNNENVLFHGRLTLKIGDKQVVRRAVGFSANKKNEGDSHKGAMTDALSKCSSYVGIAEQAFCGLVDPEDVKKAKNSNKFKSASGEQKKQEETKEPNERKSRVRTPKKDIEEPKTNDQW